MATKTPELIERARIIKGEIQQIFSDAAYWNENVRKPEEAPIDPDPDGDLKRVLTALNKYLDGVTVFRSDDIQKVIDDLDTARSWVPPELALSLKLASMLLCFGPDEIEIPGSLKTPVPDEV